MMHTIPTSRRLSAIALILLGSGCSVFPAAEMPPFVEHDLEVRWAPADEPREVTVPASSDAITVYRLELEPDHLGERFADGERYLLLPADTGVTARCRLRIWAPLPGATSADLFPGAASVRELP